MSDVFEMKLDGFRDIYLDVGYAHLLHKVDSIGMRAVGSAESRHGHAYYAFPVESEVVESLHRYEECQRRVESS